MEVMAEDTRETRASSWKDRAARGACIDLDRFCEGCGYNLRTLRVECDDRTGIPVVLCPECGRYQSANDAATVLRPWLNRLTSLLLAGWILVVIAAFLHLGLAAGALGYATLDELTIHGGYTQKQVINSTTTTWSRGYGPLEIKPAMENDRLFVGAMLALSVATGFTCALIAVVVCPHWRRVAYVALVTAIPTMAGAIVAATWEHEAPQLFVWGLEYLLAHLGAQLAGGMAGVVMGRRFARLMVRMFLPPGVRPRLAFLWLADGKPPPSR